MKLYKSELKNYAEILSKSIKIRLSESKLDLIKSIKEIENLIDGKLKTSKHNLEKTIEVLTKLSPLQVLKNGYAFIEKDKKRVSSAESVNVGDELLITLYDGKIKAEVKEKEN